MIQRKLVFGVALLLVKPAVAQSPILPDDLLLTAPRGLSTVASIKQTTLNTFEVTRYIDQESNAETFNMVTFCVASSLAKKQGYSGWIQGHRPTEERQPGVITATVVLLNGATEAADLPATLQWTPYIDAATSRAKGACRDVVRPKYL